MSRAARAALLALIVLLCGFTCTSVSKTASTSPGASPSSGASSSTPTSPSAAASAASTSTPTSTPSTAPSGAPLAITSLPFHGGEVGVNYSAIGLGASGGHPPYSWSLAGGSLPAGLNLTTRGVVGGTPSGAGKPAFTVEVSDSAGATASAPGSINVVPTMAVSQPCANLCSVEQGCTVCGNFGGISGGQGPFSYTITQDNRPFGMGVNGLNLTGAFPAPGGVGQFGLVVSVRDAFGVTATDTANWFVFSHISFAGGNISCPWPGCTVQFPYSGGTPSGAVSATVSISSYSNNCPFPPASGQCPPPEHTVSAKAGGGVVTITVTNSGLNRVQWGTNGWTGTLAIVLTDSSPCGPGNCNTGKVTIPITVIAG